MYAQVEKTKENKTRAVANSVAQKKSNVKQGFGFVDNRLHKIHIGALQRNLNTTPMESMLTASKSRTTSYNSRFRMKQHVAQLVKADELVKNNCYTYKGKKGYYRDVNTMETYIFTEARNGGGSKVFKLKKHQLKDVSLCAPSSQQEEVFSSTQEEPTISGISFQEPILDRKATSSDIKAKRADLEATTHDTETCKQFGNEAIAYATKMIPKAGNQKENIQFIYPVVRMELTKGMYKQFQEYVKTNSENEDMKSYVARALPPTIRQNIITMTHGGMCGEYATLVYLYLKEEKKIPCKIFKSAGHGEHAWVMMRSSEGVDLCIDAWPTENREVVPIEEFFETIDFSNSKDIQEIIEFYEKEKNELEVKKLWESFYEGIVEHIMAIPNPFNSKYRFPRATVITTRKVKKTVHRNQ
ncbi:MAG: hypothetical protein F6K40_31495 [Okeania sp. SIO3I5]|uniref:hypothetical protein n=1 Tax=Okeania sp. SIO3I5 TaxID=2607805 RepID=UPI0013B5F13F|nr:hypothetical protein [Okeania sp. SIO3I5]NEQ40512.1 hypothetical protein [Okeania sp. SIO3I5]